MKALVLLASLILLPPAHAEDAPHDIAPKLKRFTEHQIEVRIEGTLPVTPEKATPTPKRKTRARKGCSCTVQSRSAQGPLVATALAGLLLALSWRAERRP